MSRFYFTFILLLFQCNEINDSEAYKNYQLESRLVDKHLEAYRDLESSVENSMSEVKYSRIRSANFELKNEFFHELQVKKSEILYKIASLNKKVNKNSRLSYNAYNEVKYFNNNCSNKFRDDFVLDFDSIISEINTAYSLIMNRYADSLEEYRREYCLDNLKNLDSSLKISSNLVFPKKSSYSNIDLLTGLKQLQLANEAKCYNYMNSIVLQSSVMRYSYPEYETLVVVENNLSFPKAENQILLKTDNHNFLTKKLLINGKVQKDFDDLEIYTYKFKNPSKVGLYHHEISLEVLTPAGEHLTKITRIPYRVIDSIKL